MGWQSSPGDRLEPMYYRWLTEVLRLSHTMAYFSPVQLRVLRMQWFDGAFADVDSCDGLDAGDAKSSCRTGELPKQARELHGHELAMILAGGYFIREIMLMFAGGSLSHGRLCIPARTWAVIGEEVLALGDRPIGEAILHHNHLTERSPFSYRQLSQRDWVDLGMGGPCAFRPWSRVSCFTLAGGLPLLLTESLSPILASFDLDDC